MDKIRCFLRPSIIYVSIDVSTFDRRSSMFRPSVVDVSTVDHRCFDRRSAMFRPSVSDVSTVGYRCFDRRSSMFRPIIVDKPVHTRGRQCFTQSDVKIIMGRVSMHTLGRINSWFPCWGPQYLFRPLPS